MNTDGDEFYLFKIALTSEFPASICVHPCPSVGDFFINKIYE
jgi:hypothetical protein